MKIDIEDKKEDKKILDTLFNLYIESIQEEINFKNRISDKILEHSFNRTTKELLQFK